MILKIKNNIMEFRTYIIILFEYIFKLISLLLSPIFIYKYDSKKRGIPAVHNPLLMKSALELGRMIKAREITSEEVVKAFIDRIIEINPILNIVVANRFNEALEEARHIDSILDKQNNDSSHKEYSPFFGVPITTKESIQIKGLPNTSGLLYRKDVISNENADVIEILCQAGCIPLAVTNISELCMWYESANLVYGQSNNAYHQGRMVGGSSGGEGCIQTSAASPLGIGTDIGGSIRIPSCFNGIFGHKPSAGIISNRGQFPSTEGVADTFNGTGPMTRFACDLLPAIKLLVKYESKSLLKLDQKVDIRKLKFYYMEDDGGQILTNPVHSDIKKAILKAANHFKSLGCSVEKVSIELMRHSVQIWAAKMINPVEPLFCNLMGNFNHNVNPFKELLLWVLRWPRHTLPSITFAIAEKMRAPAETNKLMQDNCDKLKLEFKNLLGNDGVFLYPTYPLPAPYHNQSLLLGFSFGYTAMFNVLGLPVTAIPMGLAKKEEVPIGIQAAASLYNDHLTIAVAEELERVFGGWVPPFKNSLKN